jgi:hypothetical protein
MLKQQKSPTDDADDGTLVFPSPSTLYFLPDPYINQPTSPVTSKGYHTAVTSKSCVKETAKMTGGEYVYETMVEREV